MNLHLLGEVERPPTWVRFTSYWKIDYKPGSKIGSAQVMHALGGLFIGSSATMTYPYTAHLLVLTC